MQSLPTLTPWQRRCRKPCRVGSQEKLQALVLGNTTITDDADH